MVYALDEYPRYDRYTMGLTPVTLVDMLFSALPRSRICLLGVCVEVGGRIGLFLIRSAAVSCAHRSFCLGCMLSTVKHLRVRYLARLCAYRAKAIYLTS